MREKARWFRRMLAVKFFFWYHGNAAQAAHHLESETEEQPPLTARLVKKWASRFTKTGTLEDAPRSGRPEKVPHERVLECGKVLRDGVMVDGEVHHYWHDIDEAADADPIFDETCHQYTTTRKGLMAMIRRADPLLDRRREEVKWGFTPHERALRVAIAEGHLAAAAKWEGYAQTLVLLDEASLHVCEQTGSYVWCTKHCDRPVKLVPHVGNTFKQKVKWYLAVNARLGAFGPYFTTGTTGLPPQFTVRWGCPWVGSPAAYSVWRK